MSRWETPDEWLAQLDPAVRRAQRRRAEAEQHEAPPPPPVPNADQGYLGPGSSAVPQKRSADSWLMELTDSQATRGRDLADRSYYDTTYRD